MDNKSSAIECSSSIVMSGLSNLHLSGFVKRYFFEGIFALRITYQDTTVTYTPQITFPAGGRSMIRYLAQPSFLQDMRSEKSEAF